MAGARIMIEPRSSSRSQKVVAADLHNLRSRLRFMDSPSRYQGWTWTTT
ncbi:unnamed protein product [Acidithrix sp. C25]|nr:unnamed protein product [Acidithrix sp. C25]